MSITKTLVLTRPFSASQRTLQLVEAAARQPVQCVTSPIMKIEAFGEWPSFSDGDACILTTANAVQGCLDGVTAHCVGANTAQAAQEAGALPGMVALDGVALCRRLVENECRGGFVHLAGSHKAVDVASLLSQAGLSCQEIQVYAQVDQALSRAAIDVLEGERPAVLPLYSPRSARMIGEGVRKCGAQLEVICLSEAVAREWRAAGGGKTEVLAQPTGEDMVSRIVAAIQC